MAAPVDTYARDCVTAPSQAAREPPLPAPRDRAAIGDGSRAPHAPLATPAPPPPAGPLRSVLFRTRGWHRPRSNAHSPTRVPPAPAAVSGCRGPHSIGLARATPCLT